MIFHDFPSHPAMAWGPAMMEHPLPSGLGHLGRVNHKLRLRQRSWCHQDIVTCTAPGIRLRRPGAPHLRGSGEAKITDVCWMDGKIYAFYVDISCIYKSSICKFVRLSPFIMLLQPQRSFCISVLKYKHVICDAHSTGPEKGNHLGLIPWTIICQGKAAYFYVSTQTP